MGERKANSPGSLNPLKDAEHILSVIDQVHERMMQANWETIRDKARFIQSLLHKYQPRLWLSDFMFSVLPSTFKAHFQPAPATNQTEAVAEQCVDVATAVSGNCSWELVLEALSCIAQAVSEFVGRRISFDERHIMHLKVPAESKLLYLL